MVQRQPDRWTASQGSDRADYRGWIVEIPELRGLRRSDFDKRKGVPSRGARDRARLAYGPPPRRGAPLQYVPIATTNEEAIPGRPDRQSAVLAGGRRRFRPGSARRATAISCGPRRRRAKPTATASGCRNHLWPEGARAATGPDGRQSVRNVARPRRCANSTS